MPVVDILLYNIRSVYNTAAIFRTAECLGVRKIWLAGYTPAPLDRFGRARPDFHKVALGTENIIAWQVVEDVKAFIATQQEQAIKVVGLEQASTSQALTNYQPDKNILLVPGSETTGLEAGVLQLCDEVIEINQTGAKESLNVHAATAIAIWHLRSGC